MVVILKNILALCSLYLISLSICAQQQTVGLFFNGSASFNGYTLFSPIAGTNTYLIDNCGFIVNKWTNDLGVGMSAYLLENGNLLRACKDTVPNIMNWGGGGGRVQIKNWNNTLIWDYPVNQDFAFRQHHDVEYLPNGNVLILAWEYYDSSDCIANGRMPALLPDGFIASEKIIEVQPTGLNSGNIVWEWHMWDHLIQDYDSTKANYGVVGNHPELWDLNFTGDDPDGGADWIHANSIDYNETRDQIVISSRMLSEIYIIDHSTSSLEASGHTGGNSGKGGDILYRWGNPVVYDAGTLADQRLFVQHDANWIPAGYPDAGKIMIFNNGTNRPGGSYSSVDIINPPLDSAGNYILAGPSYGPVSADWSWSAPNPADFFSRFISGASRLPNGNTLVCNGLYGEFFEIGPNDSIVWRYISPVTMTAGILAQGDTIPSPWGPDGTDNLVFRAYRYGPDFPGLQAKNLTPTVQVEQLPWTSNCQLFVGMDDTPGLISWEVFPNPASNHFSVTIEKSGNGLYVYDMFGRIRYASQNPGKMTSISTEDWKNGLYIIRCGTETKKLLIAK